MTWANLMALGFKLFVLQGMTKREIGWLALGVSDLRGGIDVLLGQVVRGFAGGAQPHSAEWHLLWPCQGGSARKWLKAKRGG